MHVFTHLSPKGEGKTGFGLEADGMVEHDNDVGLLLAKLKELGLEDNTIVIELNVVRDAINSRHILRHTAKTLN
jgi:hypothetical protein